jgi:hypothetical protein
MINSLVYIYIFSHSQDKTTPQCPFSTTKMQDGYSFMGMQGDTYAAHQDLGKTLSIKSKYRINLFRFF